MNTYQRDTVKTVLHGFKTSSYVGKSDRNLRTDRLAPGPFIDSTRKGHTLPTFEDLLDGLQRLPAGLDARGLTQCLSWYLNIRDTFTPKLELNVIHTQSLIRALREPLKPFGPQNLDRNALEEWRDKGTFETLEIESKKYGYKDITAQANALRRTQLHLNLDEDDVSMSLTIPVRRVLMFPFLALHGVASIALKMGIQKAENREAAREVEATKRALEARWTAEEEVVEENKTEELQVDEAAMKPATMQTQQPYRIPKRPHPVDTDMLSVHKKRAPNTDLRNESVPRRLSPAPTRSHDMTYRTLSWQAPTVPSSAYAPPYQQQQHGQPDVYGRRDYQVRQPEPRSSDPHPYPGRSGVPGGSFGHGGQYPQPSPAYKQHSGQHSGQHAPPGPLYDRHGNVIQRW
jgi:hypothetical protein